ncbi:unnamed protein product [Bursaphelenchus okinawaensis]|uniref:Flavin-containing monooxygenase n=1 Tax=Bursaphelenchus okinawaensis TaxID=465554 RepID=A0A811JQP2_9BILA|nr:unnamed protein product [Bursaphelenchus okinawaensis]CAG9078816.1 unnamed protein product [Bursaphelenchus okinawaensis]
MSKFGQLVKRCQFREVKDALGSGNFGTVYRAFDTHMKKLVALKILGKGKQMEANYKREVQGFFKWSTRSRDRRSCQKRLDWAPKQPKMVRLPHKSVCVIGGGAAGLCAAKHLIDNGFKVVVYEQQSEIGGTWVYSEKTDVFSSLYEKMITNIPKEIMRFEDYPFETKDASSFVPHQEVLAYLQRYSASFRHVIKCNTTVVKVERNNNSWQVTTRPVQSTGQENESTQEFDAVFVCNGHFAQPRILGCAKKLKIPWIHCHNYRKPDGYKGQNVLIIGGGPSGTDVAIQISQFAKSVHLLYDQKIKYVLPPNVQCHSRLGDVSDDGKTFLLESGEELKNVDSVIFCTGYTYDVPFFDSTDKNSKKLVEVKGNGSYIAPLYQHCVHPSYPNSLYFIGLCWSLIPFVLFDHQIQYCIALMMSQVPVPSQEEMWNFEENRLRELKKNAQPVKFYHRMHTAQWVYFELLSKVANRPHTLPPVAKAIYEHVHDQRQVNLTTYKANRYRIVDENTFEFTPVIDQVFD